MWTGVSPWMKDSMNLLISILKEMNFQYIFIDCPAGIDVGFINAIAGANEAIVITTPEITAIRDADRVAGLLEVGPAELSWCWRWGLKLSYHKLV
jgi:septum formation inhibitor-activating ATPase MinD